VGDNHDAGGHIASRAAYARLQESRPSRDLGYRDPVKLLAPHTFGAADWTRCLSRLRGAAERRNDDAQPDPQWGW
jgi:hypothetical protein